MHYIIVHFSNIFVDQQENYKDHPYKQIGEVLTDKFLALDTAHTKAEDTATTLLLRHVGPDEEISDDILNIFEVREYKENNTDYEVIFRSIEKKEKGRRYHDLKIYSKH